MKTLAVLLVEFKNQLNETALDACYDIQSYGARSGGRRFRRVR